MGERMEMHAEGSPSEPDPEAASQELDLARTTLYAEVRRLELAELDRDLALLEAEEGISSKELAARVGRGELVVTMRRAWWLAQWRLRERLTAARTRGLTPWVTRLAAK